MEGINGVLVGENYGAHYIVVDSLGYGIDVIAQTDEARTRRAFYLRRVYTGTFTLDLIFSNYREFKQFCDWMIEWFQFAGSNYSSYMRVVVQSQEFDRYAMPTKGVWFGDSVGAMTYHVVLEFDGARQPGDDPGSKFVNATQDLLHAQYYYPAGTQLAAGEIGADTFFDIPPSNPLNNPIIVPPKPPSVFDPIPTTRTDIFGPN